MDNIITLTLSGALKVTKKPDVFAEIVMHALTPEERNELTVILLKKYHEDSRRCLDVAKTNELFKKETASQTAVCP